MTSVRATDANHGDDANASIDAADRLLLARAVELAAQGMFSVTANPRVGCVLFNNGQIIGRGYHQRAGDAHAEVNALLDARRDYGDQIEGATAYVSLEPCSHTGRTPACSGALIDAGIARVVVAMQDPHPKVAGEGIKQLQAAGIAVDVVDLSDAEQLNYGHKKRMLTERPYVRIKVAQSLDGRTAMASGESKWITGPVARRDVQYWRARSGAVITGAGTVVADNPKLSVREDALGAVIDGHKVVRQPLRVVLDSTHRAPVDCDIFTDGAATLWVGGVAPDASTPEPSGAACEVLAVAGESPQSDSFRPDIDAVLAELAQRGCNEVLVEAGGGLVGEFLRRDIWDELLIYSAPKLLGSDARPTADLLLATMSQAIEAKIGSVDRVGTDMRTRLVRSDRNLETFDVVPLGVPTGFLDPQDPQ